MRSMSPRALSAFSRGMHTTPVLRSAPASSKAHHIVTYPSSAFPAGYTVGGAHAGIKKSGAHDLGVLLSTSPSTSAAACMTRNVFKAAPVTVTADLLARHAGRARGFVVNSGCANAVTGKKGLEDAWAMSNAVASSPPPSASSASASASSASTSSASASATAVAAPSAGESEGHFDGGVLVMSTGVIGQHLPIDAITSAIPPLVGKLDGSADSWMDLAKAFMTTDTFPKLRTHSFALGDRVIKLAGIDKGAGMIAPNMGGPPHATLLGVIATDAAVEPASLQKALEYAVDRSFNSITVDGDMSTNDTILCLANAAGGGKEISEKGSPEEFAAFREELRAFAEELAKLVVRDGEGATKFVTVRVKGAPSFEVANLVAKSVASSSLVKTAMYGQDANWGRILCAVGYTILPPGAKITPTNVSVCFHPPSTAANTAPIRLLTNGEPESNIDEARASEILSEEDLEVVVDLGDGAEEARVWTCDFSHEYVTINGSYRS